MAGRTAIGLDIGTSAVRAAQISRGRDGTTTLERFGEVALPVGAVRDGEVVDPDTVARVIKNLGSQARLSGKKVAIGVANQKVVVRMVDLPWMPMGELRRALAFHVQDFIPMPVESAVLDFHPVEERVEESGTRTLRGMLVAASRDMVMNAVTAARGAGLTPVTVDLDSFALLRAVGTPDDLGMHGRVEALVDVGARVTNVVVHEGGVPRFVRILLMGGDDLVDAVVERGGVSYERAQELTWQRGLPLTLAEPAAATVPMGAFTEPSVRTSTSAQDPVGRALETAGAALLEEIRSSLDYHVASTGSAPIDRALVTGGGARLHGLAERLQAVIRTPVELGRPLDGLQLGRVRLAPEQIHDLEPSTAVPVGLALGALA